jgi:hypothetical protein
MTNPEIRPAPDDSAAFDRGFDGHALRQARMGLRLTPAERLRWLESAMEELRRLLGRAKLGRPMGNSP